MKDCAITGDNSQLGDSDGVTHPCLGLRARNPLFVSIMRSITDLVKLQGGEYTAVITRTLTSEPRYDTYGK
jgi:hypothetical protein